MTHQEEQVRIALLHCTMLPGCFDKLWVRNMNPNRPMTEKGRAFASKLLHKYRRQIKNYETLKAQFDGKD